MNASLAKADQLSVFLENKAGQLARLLKLLGDNAINIRALSLADTSDFGILRLILSNPDLAAAILKDNGFTVGRTPVLAVELADSPGSLSLAVDLVSQNGINVEYMYACARRKHGQAIMIFRFDQTDKALRLLQENGYPIINSRELQDI